MLVHKNSTNIFDYTITLIVLHTRCKAINISELRIFFNLYSKTLTNIKLKLGRHYTPQNNTVVSVKLFTSKIPA